MEKEREESTKTGREKREREREELNTSQCGKCQINKGKKHAG
jgi:hypothetical protein